MIPLHKTLVNKKTLHEGSLSGIFSDKTRPNYQPMLTQNQLHVKINTNKILTNIYLKD
jgi:hypothetical protein